MGSPYPPVEVKVWGDFACFTRPEMKVERVSYEVMTPSAARGLLSSIFWKPEFDWRIRQIRVLNPIRYYSILRNEVNKKAAVSTARTWEREGGGFFADDSDEQKNRAQRHTLALRDVAYVIVADIVVRPGVQEDAAKYRDQFHRRVERGQYFMVPCLGCREFPAQFALPDGSEQPQSGLTISLGRILFDLDYAPDTTGRGTPRFFEAEIIQGVLRVPPELYERRQS